MTIRCNNCYWVGQEDDLKQLEDEINGCPNCETDGYLMDIEEDYLVTINSGIS